MDIAYILLQTGKNKNNKRGKPSLTTLSASTRLFAQR